MNCAPNLDGDIIWLAYDMCVFRPTSLKKLASSKPWVAPFTLGNRQSGYTMLYSPLFL